MDGSFRPTPPEAVKDADEPVAVVKSAGFEATKGTFPGQASVMGAASDKVEPTQ